MSRIRITEIACALSDRQRAYLLSAFEEDQARAAALSAPGTAPRRDRRWLEFGPVGERGLNAGSFLLRRALEQQDLVDSGSGATWATLAARGLIDTRHADTGFIDAQDQRPIQSLSIRLTRDGRMVAKVLRGEPPRRPRMRRPLSLPALRLIAYGQRYPGDVFTWSAPWSGILGLPDYAVMVGIACGLINRGLLAGDPPHALRITQAGLALELAAEPNWLPLPESRCPPR